MTTHRTTITIQKRQSDFLTGFEFQYWEATGKRVSRSEVIRALIDHLASLEKSYQTILVRSILEESQDEE